MSGIDALRAVEAELAVRLLELGEERLQDHAGVIAEVHALEDPAHDAVRAVVLFELGDELQEGLFRWTHSVREY